jgi:hypothetical protein
MNKMNKINKIIMLIVLVFIMGCDGAEESSIPPAVDLTGTWNGSMIGLPTADTFTLVLTQNGSDIAGTYINNLMQECSVSGVVSGNNVSLTLLGITLSGYRANINGTASDTTASGGFSDNYGNAGSWSAVKW